MAMTNKEYVLSKYPDAMCKRIDNPAFPECNYKVSLNNKPYMYGWYGKTANQVWKITANWLKDNNR